MYLFTLIFKKDKPVEKLPHVYQRKDSGSWYYVFKLCGQRFSEGGYLTREIALDAYKRRFDTILGLSRMLEPSGKLARFKNYKFL